MNKITTTKLNKMKQAGEKFTCLTAYDASFAIAQENAGVEVILVGDSLGMVVKGQVSTLSVTMDEMIYHTANVSRVCQKSLIMSDLPFAADVTKEQAYSNSARLISEGGAHMVKIEGGAAMLETVQFLAQRGVAVCSHLGLLPQSVYKMGGYRIQGRTADEAEQILNDAIALEQAGADLLLLECVPAELATRITQSVTIPVIGIGAGSGCDAQVLVCYDMLGLTHGNPASFVKNFLQDTHSIQDAFKAYVEHVKNGQFPAPEHTFN
ncbi:MAG: 3-methyl-2-oxobutanoate hydroxymethyltransferase [gamma proteobacterium symbiont of Bathyaustriella thionipta]|nr:3-methyl-2-oxobutanoate hydroxymethyltransferase [gamma proteobacterium symbiont of Bathyaustriella thionipta]MCU7948634.1 3-methyl-2-oxobutanoate hydroxymethyltransferase [gamma proteobacterium symbiont of Bathyaustriella thionipta]MCU7953040.1 3-methyl-2-oxobutanoate hydroxymethyltransferase [gamma proteobacterium symbiont of Bathyaustriella thionipta]MCU7955360.1 3-methyl-2-oxobutanoate hydroxymethyltransferase [gamma proteobacterium symbiont of Bathyaustriella thionipta]MCU7967514.1 3-me